jgi:uncharacterized protein
MKKIYFIAICILSIRPSNAVSFDCNKAITELEKKICSSEEIEAVTELEKTISSSQEISILETKVTATYTKLLLSNPEIKNNQIEWLKKISHCDKNTYVDCVKNAYTDRLSELNHQLHSTSWIAADDAREKQKAEMVNANGVGEISKAAAEKVAARDAERVAAAREAADTAAAKAQVYADRLAGEKIYAGYQAQQVTQRATADATGKQNTEAEKLTTEKVQAAKTETTKKSADKATKDAVPKADSDRFVAEKVLADLQAKQASDRAREDEAERKAAIAVQKSKDEEFVKKFIY